MPQPYYRSPWVSSFHSDAGLLLFDTSLNRLFAFNDSARLLWESIERGSGIDEVASLFVATYGIPLETALHDINAMIMRWRVLDLLTDDENISPPAPTQPPAASDWSQVAGVWQDKAVYSVRGKSFSLATESAQSTAMMRRFFHHLENPRAEVGLRLEVRQTVEGSSALLIDGREEVRTHDEAQLIGGINQAILEFLHPGFTWLAMMHGGAVMHDGAGVLLPAPSGSGKTTLIAHLIARKQFTYLADDMIALAAPSGRVVPWPMPLSVKEGSWPLLVQVYPNLQTTPCYSTSRGSARLIVPSPADWETDPVPVRAIIFPKHVAGAAAELTQVSTFQAIERLLADRIWLGHPVTEERVTAFLTWLNDTSAFAVTYDDLNDGRRLIESTLG